MAIPIGPFQAYVNEVKVFNWGSVANVAHNQVKKNDAGEWETVGRDYFSFVIPQGVTVAKGDKVEITGKLKTKLYDKADGSKGVSLEIRAESVTPVAARGGNANNFTAFGAVEIEDSPF